MAQIKTKFITDNAVTNAKAAQVAAYTIKGNNTASTANQADLSVSQVKTLLGAGAASGLATLDSDGLVPISQMNPAALERIYVAADQTARYALTITDVQNGDTVYQTDNGVMYMVKDQTNLGNSSGYQSYSAGTAVNVSGVVAIANGGTGASTKAGAFGALSPMTTGGDLIYGGASGTGTRLANGSAGQLLQSNGTTLAPSWITAPVAATPTEKIITLSSGDITAQYVDLGHVALGSSASVNSISLTVVGGLEQLKVVDYTVALTGGGAGDTRITFTALGDLCTGGAAELIAGDILLVKYSY